MHGKPIIPGEVLNTRPIDYEAKKPGSVLSRRRIAKFGKCLLVYGICTFAYNAAALHDKFSRDGKRDDVEMIEDADLCQPFDHVGTEPDTGEIIVPDGFTIFQAQQTLNTEATFALKTSSAYNFKPKSMNPLETIEQVININSHEFDSFTSRYSGLDVHLYSDTEDPFESIDKTVIDDLLHASLDEEIEFDHIAVTQFMDCARDLILLDHGGSLIKGERLNVYIAGKPGVCWSNGLIQDFPKNSTVPFKEFCDSSGATIKDLTVHIVPGLVSHKQSWLAVTSHRFDPSLAGQKVSQGLMHEFIHYVQQATGLPFKYNPNERLADHIEVQTQAKSYSQSYPIAVSYTQDQP